MRQTPEFRGSLRPQVDEGQVFGKQFLKPVCITSDFAIVDDVPARSVGDIESRSWSKTITDPERQCLNHRLLFTLRDKCVSDSERGGNVFHQRLKELVSGNRSSPLDNGP